MRGQPRHLFLVRLGDLLGGCLPVGVTQYADQLHAGRSHVLCQRSGGPVVAVQEQPSVQEGHHHSRTGASVPSRACLRYAFTRESSGAGNGRSGTTPCQPPPQSSSRTASGQSRTRSVSRYPERRQCAGTVASARTAAGRTRCPPATVRTGAASRCPPASPQQARAAAGSGSRAVASNADPGSSPRLPTGPGSAAGSPAAEPTHGPSPARSATQAGLAGRPARPGRDRPLAGVPPSLWSSVQSRRGAPPGARHYLDAMPQVLCAGPASPLPNAQTTGE